MKTARTLFAECALLLATFVGNAFADDTKLVRTFYDLLSNPGSAEHAEAFQAASTDGWARIGNDSGKNMNAEMFAGQMGRFAKLVLTLN